MLNARDVQTLRDKGNSNSEILKIIGRVVPSASKAYSDFEADQKTPIAMKEQYLGKMLDDMTPKDTPSGLPYVSAVGLGSAQKSYDSLEKQYQAVEKAPVDDGFSVGGLVKGIGSNLKGLARAALGVPMVATYHLFKTADDLSSLLSGTEPTKLNPDQQKFVKDMHRQAYEDLPTAAMLYSGLGGASAVATGAVSGSIASGQKALAKAGVAPEGSPKGKDVSLMSIPYEGAKKFVDGYTTFTGPMKSVIAKNTLYNAAQQVLDGMVYDTPDKSMGQLLEDSLAGGVTAGFMYRGAQKFQSADAVKKFIIGEPAVPKDANMTPAAGKSAEVPATKVQGDGSAPLKSAPGEQFAPDGATNIGQSTIEHLTGLRPGSQEAAVDPQMRGMVDDFRSGKVSPQKIVLEDLENAFTKSMKDVSDAGKEYNFIRGSKQSMFMPTDQMGSILNKYGFEYKTQGQPTADPVTGLLMKKGQLMQSETSKPISGTQFAHLQKALHIIGSPDVAATPQMFRTAKSLLQDLGSFYDPQLPGGGGEVRAMAGELLGVLEGARRSKDAPSDFQKYAELDDRYAPERKQYESLKDEYFTTDQVTGGLRFKDNAPKKIMNSLRGDKFNALERLERASPGITRKLQAYEAYRDIVESGSTAKTIAKATKIVPAAIAAGVTTGGLGAIAVGVVGVLASSPAVMWSALNQYAKISGKSGWDPLGIVTKAENGAPFTPAEADAIKGVVKVITEDYAKPIKASPDDDVPLSQLDPQGVEDARQAEEVLSNGGTLDDALKTADDNK